MSPTGQGVDHRQVQRELGEVAVQLQGPVTLSAASIRVSWTVSVSPATLSRGFYARASHRSSSSPSGFHGFAAQVDRQSPFIQGYRLFYRPSGGSWLLHDINSPSERSTVLADLLKGTEYELKIRPYFDEFQGKDSRTLLVRTPEEGRGFKSVQKKSHSPKLNHGVL